MRRFFGLSLDVRHVTRSAGTLTFAGTALGPSGCWSQISSGRWRASTLVGVVNLTVSFSLGLSAAMRARGLEPVNFLCLVGAVLAGGLRPLFDFIRPSLRACVPPVFGLPEHCTSSRPFLTVRFEA